ncbi:hypothetical protein Tco_0846900, partial [Tanacetum coccineum]
MFDHVHAECPKNTDSGVVKNMKKPGQAPRGVPVGPKVGFKPVKQVFRQVSKKNNVNTSGNKKKDADAEPTIEVSNSNSFDVLNSVEIDVYLGTNGGTSNLASKKANFGGSSSLNVEASSTNTTPIVDKIDKYEKLVVDGKVSLVDDEGKSLKNVAYSENHDSEDEVESVDNDMAHFMASEMVGFGNNSLLELWRDTYENVDYDYDPYDDDGYEGQEFLTRFSLYVTIWISLSEVARRNRWDTQGGAYDRSRGNRRNCLQTGAETNSGDYTPYETMNTINTKAFNQRLSQDDRSLHLTITAKHPRTWEAQFQAGIKTIALVAVREGVIQLGSIHKLRQRLTTNSTLNVTPSMSSLEALLSKLPSVVPVCSSPMAAPPFCETAQPHFVTLSPEKEVAEDEEIKDVGECSSSMSSYGHHHQFCTS